MVLKQTSGQARTYKPSLGPRRPFEHDLRGRMIKIMSTITSGTSRPNILLITTDTQRCDSLGCMGSDFAISPNLDRLAKSGVLFEQGHTVSPVCGPARASLLTGVHTPIHGATENNLDAHEHLTPLPDLLADVGYRNIMVGKTHFKRPTPSSFHVTHELRGEKGINNDDFYGQHMAKHGYERATSHPNPVPAEKFCDAFLADTMIDEITQHIAAYADQPFFGFCSMLSPHSPYDPPGKWAHLFDNVELPPINYVPGEVDHMPAAERELVLYGKGMPTKSFPDGHEPDMAHIDHIRKLYYGLCAYCDHQIGRIIDHLDATGLRENTLVIFTSDHGTTMFDHGFENKHTFFDSSWRVPFIMSQPGTLPEGACEEFATWLDIHATALSVAGIDWPAAQGFDLYRPLVAGQSNPRTCATGTIYETAAVTTCRWKLEYYLQEGVGRLFDRTADPHEQANLYHDAGYQPLRDRMTQALLSWRAELCDIESLHERNKGGGPVARYVSELVKSRTGLDAERRLQERLAEIDDWVK